MHERALRFRRRPASSRPGSARRRAAVVVLSAAVEWVACGHPALLRQVEKLGLVNNMQHLLLESVEAEKSAVLAVTDEESKAFATQSKRSAEEIDRLRTRLAALIAEDER